MTTNHLPNGDGVAGAIFVVLVLFSWRFTSLHSSSHAYSSRGTMQGEGRKGGRG